MSYAPVIGWALCAGVATIPLWKVLSGLIEINGEGRKITLGGTTSLATLGALGVLAYWGGGGVLLVGGGNSKGLGTGVKEFGSYVAPGTPAIQQLAVVDTSTVWVQGDAFSGDQDDTQDSIHVAITRVAQDTTTIVAETKGGAQIRDTVVDNTNLKADTTYTAYLKYKGLNGGWSAWSAPDTFVMSVAALTGGDGVFVFNGGPGGDNAAGDSAGVKGAAFSGTVHDSTHIQVNELADGDFTTTLLWDTRLGPVTTDTVTGLDSATVYIARIRYKDNGTWQAYDTLGTFAAAFGPQGGPNEPAGMTALIGRAFNDMAQFNGEGRGLGSFPWKYDQSEGYDDHEGGESNIFHESTHTDAPFSPPTALAFRYPSPNPVGPTQSFSPGQVQTNIFTNSGSAPGAPLSLKQVYYRFAIKLGTDFQVHPSGQKLVFFRQYDGGTKIAEPFVKISDPSGGTAVASLGWSLQGTQDNARTLTKLSSTDMEEDTWYDVEIHLVLSTGVSSTNGEVHQWMRELPNGTRTKVYEATDVEMRNSGDTGATAVWGAIRFDPVYGGLGGTIDPEFYWYLDHAWFSGSESY